MIYLDHAATTAVDSAVFEAMKPYFCEFYGNPNSQHQIGKAAMHAVDKARDEIAALLGVLPKEIYFTSGGTESDNWALRGALTAEKNHAILSAIEHPALLETAKELRKQGFEISLAPVDESGKVLVAEAEKLVRPTTALLGCMYANNETGVLQPVLELKELAKAHGCLFFTDAVQAMGSEKIDLSRIDLLSFSAHKFHGPKGIGCLFVRSGTKLSRILTGGHQERSMRGGTTNVPAVVGMAKALELAFARRESDNRKIAKLRDTFLSALLPVEGITLNGSLDRLHGNANLRFAGVGGESMLFNLDLAGICASTGSACTSGAVHPSHVLLAMGQSETSAKESVRFTFGRDNTMEEVNFAVAVLKDLYQKLKK